MKERFWFKWVVVISAYVAGIIVGDADLIMWIKVLAGIILLIVSIQLLDSLQKRVYLEGTERWRR